MTLAFWLAVANFWVYFHLMSVRPVGDPSTATRTRLTRPLLFRGDVLRAAAAATPIAILHDGLPLKNNLLLTWISLFVIVEPLLLPTRLEPEAKDTASLIRFGGKWIAAEVDRLVKSAVLLAPLLLLAHWVPALSSGAWMDHHFSLVPRLPDSLDLPLYFYIGIMIMLGIKTLMLLGLHRGAVIASMSGWFTGVIAVIYFFNMTGQSPLKEYEWEYPVGGALLASIVFKFTVSYNLARADAVAEGSGSR